MDHLLVTVVWAQYGPIYITFLKHTNANLVTDTEDILNVLHTFNNLYVQTERWRCFTMRLCANYSSFSIDRRSKDSTGTTRHSGGARRSS